MERDELIRDEAALRLAEILVAHVEYARARRAGRPHPFDEEESSEPATPSLV